MLILTFNRTLKNYIKDRISDVRERFNWNQFIISNYHKFINSTLNHMEIYIDYPKNLTSEERTEYLERKYFSNEDFFEKIENEIGKKFYKYKAIFIDEVQDYKKEWLDIIKKYFYLKMENMFYLEMKSKMFIVEY